MAWPTTLLTTYIPNSLPAIKATDLMAIQTAINRGFLGTYSYSGLVLDGVGGQDAVPIPGGLKTSGAVVAGGPVTLGGTAMGRTAPTPAPQRNTLYGDSLIFAYGFFYANAQLVYGMNIASCARTGTGTFVVTLINASVGDIGTIVPVVGIFTGVAAYGGAAVATPKTINITMFNAQGAAVDEPFYLIVVGN